MRIIILFFFFFSFFGFAQESILDSIYVDSKYREDQFYTGAGYNLLANKPNKLSQSGFSIFINLGFIRDFPINENRNFGFGLGAGYSFNSINQNMLIGKNGAGDYEYVMLSEAGINYSKNKFEMHMLEIPFEIRWRNSTPEKYEFVRIYFGVKAGYVFATRSIFKSDDVENQKHNGINDFNKMQYGLTLSAGYNSWNLNLYYGLSPIFKTGTVTTNNESIDMRLVRIGLVFYLL